jgi:dihydropyrimidine dehydrogenase (NAD+) subunit PreT
MSAYDFEVELAKSDGARLLTNAVPKRILGKTKVEGVEFVRSEMKNGKLIEVPRSKFVVDCDRVIKAIGQSKRFSLAKALKLEQDDAGRLVVDRATLRSSDHKVFAGGDAVNGGKEVVNAAADGKRAAYGIWKTLFPSRELPEGNDYWVSTIEGRVVAPITPRDGSHD